MNSKRLLIGVFSFSLSLVVVPSASLLGDTNCDTPGCVTVVYVDGGGGVNANCVFGSYAGGNGKAYDRDVAGSPHEKYYDITYGRLWFGNVASAGKRDCNFYIVPCDRDCPPGKILCSGQTSGDPVYTFTISEQKDYFCFTTEE